jgi:AcrR family transcriptional regulator
VSVRHERKDAAAHRQLIIQTAKALFKEHGVQSVNMHQIAKKAGIGQATLYRRYAHKGDLCFDILQESGRLLTTKVNAHLKAQLHVPAVERLGDVLDILIDELEEKSGLIIAMESKMNCEDNRGNFFHSPIYSFFRENMSLLLQEVINQEPGDQHPPLDHDLIAHTLLCSLSPVGYFHVKQERNYSTEQMKQIFRQMCLRLAVRS